MKTADRHSINRLYLEVNTHSKSKAYYLKDNLNAFLKEELFPLLETYFDTLDKKIPLYSIHIEKLNIDLSLSPDLDFNTIKREVVDQFQNQIETQIEKGFPDTEHYTLITNKEKSSNEFFLFLETGITPWWAIAKKGSDLNEEDRYEILISEKSFGLKLRNALENTQTRIRFIKQLSDDQIYMMLEKAFLLEASEKETISKTIKRIKTNMNAVISSSAQGLQQRNLIWEIILSQLLKHNESVINEKLFYLIASFDSIRKYDLKFVSETINEQISNKSVVELVSNLANEVLIITAILEEKALEILQKNSNDAFLKSNFSKTDKSSEKEKIEETNSILNNKKEVKEEDLTDLDLVLKEEKTPEIPSDYYVNNAGLILIHPFLKQLFENCRLLNKDNAINNPELAAHLLHYIATEQEQDYENEMLFEKLLCNIPANQTINRNIKIPEEFKNHVNEMLQAVLENWPVMKNSSVALLRNEYLQRPGKIILTQDNPKILVERKTQDILLDKISWNLGVVKLAWKSKVIFVEW